MGVGSIGKTYPSQIETGAPIAPLTGNFVASLATNDYIDTNGVEQIVKDKSSQVILLDGRPEKQFWGEEKHPKVLPLDIYQAQNCSHNQRRMMK